MPTAAIRISDVSKQFGQTTALHSISADIQSGQLTGLVGPDGAGKTTLMRMMAGLMTPDAGHILMRGLDTATQASQLPAFTSYMPQRFGLYEDLSVMENLQLHARLHGLSPEHRHDRFDRLLTFTRLGPFTTRLAGQLSGGMKQKLGLACALIPAPDILLLDEPGVGVDPLSRQDLWRMVNALAGEGVAVVWATAYLDEAERCEQVILLNEGRIAFQGDPARLTDTLADRSLLLVRPEAPRRNVLTQALSLPTVSDGVIQGHSVRVVLTRQADRRAVNTLADEVGATVVTVRPRFEDGFVDLLGGGPDPVSILAERMPPLTREDKAVVECRNLTRRFGDFTATDNVSFSVRKGEIFGLLGPNGAGKSTTFKMLCGLLRPSTGDALVTGLNLRTATSQAKSQLGYMAQKFSLYGLLSVRQNLEFSAGVYGLAGQRKRERIEEMIDIFQLHRYLTASPDDLPLGYRQRLALACAVMHHPPVLFLDEPTSGVDPLTRREFWTHINGIVSKGVTVLVTTHFMDEAEYCDRVALMYQARMIALDTPDALKQDAATGKHPEPSMEQAFISLIEAFDRAHASPASAPAP